MRKLYCPNCKNLVEVRRFNQCPNCFLFIPKRVDEITGLHNANSGDLGKAKELGELDR